MTFGGEILYDEHDDDDKRGRDGQMPTLRASVGEADARQTEGVPELQTDQVGRSQSLGRGYVYFFETEDSQYVKIVGELSGRVAVLEDRHARG